ncbi:hypothetical protein M0R45_012315 [Rubus argutus]|uniref:Uncharacterized protein n=1 Tax=Rubus argutus TaxID=59490 RepID=A0AAW1YD91_RUBAR
MTHLGQGTRPMSDGLRTESDGLDLKKSFDIRVYDREALEPQGRFAQDCTLKLTLACKAPDRSNLSLVSLITSQYIV